MQETQWFAILTILLGDRFVLSMRSSLVFRAIKARNEISVKKKLAAQPAAATSGAL
jgi:hypothetical protein